MSTIRNTAPSNFKEIPVVDIASLVDSDASQPDKLKTAEEIGNACRKVGFFYVKNHGIGEQHRERMFTESKRFFDLPPEEKMKLHLAKSSDYRGYVPLGGEVTKQQKDWHESLDLRPDLSKGTNGRIYRSVKDANRWPDALPGFQEVMTQSYDLLIDLGARVTRGLALSLGLNETYFDQYTGRPLCTLRLSHYPAYDETADDEDIGEGIGEHCDYGFVTILCQDEVGGLEVKNAAGEWIPAPQIAGTFIVNIGEMTQRWTNDRYTATWHRVRIPKHKSRYSIPFFYEPSYDTVVKPLAVCCSASNPSHYEPCHFGTFIIKKFSVSYARISKSGQGE